MGQEEGAFYALFSTGAARAWTCGSTFAPTDFADDCLNTSRMKDTYVVAIKMTTNGQKMAIFAT